MKFYKKVIFLICVFSFASCTNGNDSTTNINSESSFNTIVQTTSVIENESNEVISTASTTASNETSEETSSGNSYSNSEEVTNETISLGWL